MTPHRITHGTYADRAREHVYGPLVTDEPRLFDILKNDSVWSSLYSGLIWSNAVVWGVAAALFFMVSH
ncbi:hypothetical protein [Novosphingobium sp. KN65.2]|uniref:hypothetical protein n=1 Tax=Novosphingobium sp. KN65.2 TaxID=1478134 RepID=UPI0005E09FAF|nr:hypothetical protein [Novosphingobium sp. KN65.2]CDO38951.1 hypothetical protein SPHV1_880004 [Novosphingobium sp. KN65.2]